jgi:glycosyltransferase involved in cell wall biosynthesis
VDASIIIPTFNSEATIEQCLKSIRANKASLKYEILVCDAGSTDKTLEIVHKYADKVLQGIPNRINRNIGVKEAQGEIILFTDSDCLVPYDWINSLYHGLKEMHADNHLCIGIGGGNEPWLDNPTPIELSIAKAMKSPLIAFKARNTANYDKGRWVEHNPPINSAYFKDILEIYEFDERKGYPEDLDLDTRLIENRKKLYYMADCVVKHKHKTTYQAFAKQMKDFGYKRVKINREHSSVARLFHYAPAVLYLMQFSPFILINLCLATLNAIIMNDSNVFDLTVIFYNSYGRGEIEGLFSKSTLP